MLTTSVQKVHLPIKVIIPRIVTNLEVKHFCYTYPELGKSSYSAQGYYDASYFQRHFMSIGSAIVVVIRVRHQCGGQSGLTKYGALPSAKRIFFTLLVSAIPYLINFQPAQLKIYR